MEERIGYKVVTADMKSLGLKKNPNILTFPQNEKLCLPKEEVEEGKGDWGGIWVAATVGGANTLVKYMSEKYGVECRIFIAELGKVLYENSYRIKTNSVKLIKEI